MSDENVYRAHALWVQGRRICACVSYTPVDMKIIEDDFKTGAMDMAITLDGGMEKMSASFKVTGSDIDVMSYFGIVSGAKTRFEIRSAFTGTSEGILRGLIFLRALSPQSLMTSRGPILNQVSVSR